MVTSVELKREVMKFLRSQPNHEWNGEFNISNFDADDIIEATLDLRDSGELIGKFPLNPNRRSGNDFGWIKARRSEVCSASLDWNIYGTNN